MVFRSEAITVSLVSGHCSLLSVRMKQKLEWRLQVPVCDPEPIRPALQSLSGPGQHKIPIKHTRLLLGTLLTTRFGRLTSRVGYTRREQWEPQTNWMPS